MDVFVNELSIHGQFPDVATFRVAFGQLMAMRAAAARFGREVYCGRGLLSAEATPGTPLLQIIQRLPEATRRSALQWMTRGGPFWDDIRRHRHDDWLESLGRIVTDSTVGEAAYRSLHGFTCSLISVTPSDWDLSPVTVTWRRNDAALDDRDTELENWRVATALEEWLDGAPLPVQSWDHLQEISTRRFAGLRFGGTCFDPLAGVPFAKNAAERILFLCDVLDRLSHAFDESGARTLDGQRMYQDYFTGDNALFSDSSDTEKHNFRNQLTFPHPTDPDSRLFCTWHGKVSRMTLRLHYAWSGQAGDPIYVVYVGPKITRR